MVRFHGFILLLLLSFISFGGAERKLGDQPLANVAIHKAVVALHESAYVKASPSILGSRGENTEWVTVKFSSPNPSDDD